MSKERIFSAGEFIGPYEVVRVLAMGGTSTVYETRPDPARRADLLKMGISRAAVKVLKVGQRWMDRHDRKVMVDRIDREFSTLFKLMKLGHPNIVKVYDYGQEEGVPYYAMEYIDGITLDEAMAQRPRMGQMMNVFGKLCAAVSFLHNGGICHRDIKPGNVMVRREGGDPVLIDFGICFPPGERTLTGAGDLLGTPQYLSPEYGAHWMGNDPDRPYVAAPTDDVWALGIILYEMLTGGTPWKTPSDRREALLKEIQEEPLRHPSDVYAKAPRPLGDVAMKLLSRDLANRPANASAVLDLVGPAAGEADVLGRLPARRQTRPRRTSWVSFARRATLPPVHGERVTPSPEPRIRLGGLVALAALLVSCLVLGAILDRVSPTNVPAQAKANVYPCAPVEATHTDGQQASYVPMDFNALLSPSVARMVMTGMPMPDHPFKDQMRPPCLWPTKEINGGCWREIAIDYGDGKKHHCPSDFFELPGGETGWRCFKVAVLPPPSAEDPEKSKNVAPNPGTGSSQESRKK